MHCEFAQSLFLRVRYCIARKLVLTVLSRPFYALCVTRIRIWAHVSQTHTLTYTYTYKRTHTHTHKHKHTRTYSRTNLNVEGSVLCALMTMFTCARCREYDEPEDYPDKGDQNDGGMCVRVCVSVYECGCGCRCMCLSACVCCFMMEEPLYM